MSLFNAERLLLFQVDFEYMRDNHVIGKGVVYVAAKSALDALESSSEMSSPKDGEVVNFRGLTAVGDVVMVRRRPPVPADAETTPFPLKTDATTNMAEMKPPFKQTDSPDDGPYAGRSAMRSEVLSGCVVRSEIQKHPFLGEEG